MPTAASMPATMHAQMRAAVSDDEAALEGMRVPKRTLPATPGFPSAEMLQAWRHHECAHDAHAMLPPATPRAGPTSTSIAPVQLLAPSSSATSRTSSTEDSSGIRAAVMSNLTALQNIVAKQSHAGATPSSLNVSSSNVGQQLPGTTSAKRSYGDVDDYLEIVGTAGAAWNKPAAKRARTRDEIQADIDELLEELAHVADSERRAAEARVAAAMKDPAMMARILAVCAQ